ncbi:hypothetical protein FXO37_03818 [Capsicum annuum]|nr:hypothetical protein FXO37_03818 [Capsicum annuum]
MKSWKDDMTGSSDEFVNDNITDAEEFSPTIEQQRNGIYKVTPTTITGWRKITIHFASFELISFQDQPIKKIKSKTHSYLNKAVNDKHVISTLGGFGIIQQLAIMILTATISRIIPRSPMLKLGNLLLEHVYREQNKLAHALAQMNATTTIQLFWEPPASAKDILRADTNRDLSCRRVRIDTSDQILFNTTNPNCQIVNASARCAVTTVGACTRPKFATTELTRALCVQIHDENSLFI